MSEGLPAREGGQADTPCRGVRLSAPARIVLIVQQALDPEPLISSRIDVSPRRQSQTFDAARASFPLWNVHVLPDCSTSFGQVAKY
jgi:hypothetical protein